MVSSSMLFSNKLVDINELFNWKEMWEARPCSWFVASVKEEVWVEATLGSWSENSNEEV